MRESWSTEPKNFGAGVAEKGFGYLSGVEIHERGCETREAATPDPLITHAQLENSPPTLHSRAMPAACRLWHVGHVVCLHITY